jgi:hypothetical protein
MRVESDLSRVDDSGRVESDRVGLVVRSRLALRRFALRRLSRCFGFCFSLGQLVSFVSCDVAGEGARCSEGEEVPLLFRWVVVPRSESSGGELSLEGE